MMVALGVVLSVQMSLSSGFIAPEAHLHSSERMGGALDDLREKYARIEVEVRCAGRESQSATIPRT